MFFDYKSLALLVLVSHKVDRQTHPRHTAIANYGLNQPRGRLGKNHEDYEDNEDDEDDKDYQGDQNYQDD